MADIKPHSEIEDIKRVLVEVERAVNTQAKLLLEIVRAADSIVKTYVEVTRKPEVIDAQAEKVEEKK